MSRWNVDTVKGVYAAFAGGEFPHEAFHEEVEWHTDPDLPRPMTHYGLTEVASYFEQFGGAWQKLGAEPVGFEARPGECVLATVRMGPPTDGAEGSVVHLWRLRHGRVLSVRVFGDRNAAVEAARTPARPPPAGPSLPDREWDSEREYRGPAPEPVAGFVRGLEPADAALDFGCGDGRLTVQIPARTLTAADVSLVALKRARRRMPEATIVLLDPHPRLPFEPDSFDTVLCADTIQEIQDVAGLVSEVKRVLTPGGTFAITTPAHGRRTGLKVLRRGPAEVFDPRAPELRFFTQRSLGDLLDLAGFHSIHIERRDGLLLATARR